jgi:hypothetical protein
MSFSNNADDIWEQTQINTSKETLERGNGDVGGLRPPKVLKNMI